MPKLKNEQEIEILKIYTGKLTNKFRAVTSHYSSNTAYLLHTSETCDPQFDNSGYKPRVVIQFAKSTEIDNETIIELVFKFQKEVTLGEYKIHNKEGITDCRKKIRALINLFG